MREARGNEAGEPEPGARRAENETGRQGEPRVKTALIDDEQVKARNIDVEAYKGVVSLSGFVDSKSEADRAVLLAQKVDGVKSVNDDMHVRP